MKIEQKDEKLVVYLCEEIDHHIAKSMRDEIDSLSQKILPEILVLDFKNVLFMDSSGIGLVMGRYKLMQELKGNLHVVNVANHIKKVMTLAGLDKIIQIV